MRESLSLALNEYYLPINQAAMQHFIFCNVTLRSFSD